MNRDDIPPLYTLSIHYKRRALDVLNTPWVIKDRIKSSKKMLEGICKNFSLKNACRKLNDAGMLHLFFSFFFSLMGSIFFLFVVYEYYQFRFFLPLMLVPLFMSLFFFITSFGIVLDAYAKWLEKVKDIKISYDYLERMRNRRMNAA